MLAGGDRGPDALDAGECAQREPGREGADERRRPIEPDQASTDGLGQPHVTHPDTCQSPEVGAEHDVDQKTGVLEAEVDLPPLKHEPPRSRATHGRRHPAEVEAHDDPLRGQRFQVHTPMDVPHEQARVQVTAADLCTGPPLAPLAEALDKRPQLLTRRREVVFAPAATRPGHAPHDAGVLELLETSGEKRARHQGHTPVEVAEPMAPAEQLAQDQRGPSLGDDLGRLGDRAELAVPLHPGPTIVNGGGRRKSIFCALSPGPAGAILPVIRRCPMVARSALETERRDAIALDDAALADLAQHFRGELIRPGDTQYDAARAIWNGAIDRHPGLVARCTGAADVRAAVRFARERDLLVAVRGGGHNVAGTAVCDGGLVIDLSPMKGLWVDPAGRTARAQPGLLWGEFDRETQALD